jgi:hypothetical protein
MQVIAFDCFRVRLVVSHDRLRKGDAQVFNGHFIVLVRGRHSPQMGAQVLERLEVVLGQFAQKLLDRCQTQLVVFEATRLYEVIVQILVKVNHRGVGYFKRLERALSTNEHKRYVMLSTSRAVR